MSVESERGMTDQLPGPQISDPEPGCGSRAEAFLGRHPAFLSWLRRFRPLDRGEISGSLGDLGTFIPLLVGMSITNGLNFTSALFFAGVFNILTGLAFPIPMAVQPMKAIAAVAISENLRAEQILAAGIWTSAIVLILGLSRVINVVDRVIPRPVVRGLQLGLGIQLIEKGVLLVRDAGSLWGPDSVLTGILGFAIVLMLASSRRTPVALLLFCAGLVIAVANRHQILGEMRLGFYLPHWVPLTWEDFRSSFVRAALPQIPLTTLNSVIAVCALSADLFPGRPARPRRVAVSVGIMNLIGGWFGAMPMCHGAGGLAGQYRFGARSSTSIVFLGSVKMLLAIVFGGSLLTLLHGYPGSVLGVLLGVSGLELALVARDQTERAPATVMYATAGAILALGNTATGFTIGWILAVILRLNSQSPGEERG
jgi:MFS superfamily sulfate permease-like transporter